MEESGILFSGRMTFKTGGAFIYVVVYTIVLIIHFRLPVVMAIDTGEGYKITRTCVTFHTAIPLLAMLHNGKVSPWQSSQLSWKST